MPGSRHPAHDSADEPPQCEADQPGDGGKALSRLVQAGLLKLLTHRNEIDTRIECRREPVPASRRKGMCCSRKISAVSAAAVKARGMLQSGRRRPALPRLRWPMESHSRAGTLPHQTSIISGDNDATAGSTYGEFEDGFRGHLQTRIIRSASIQAAIDRGTAGDLSSMPSAACVSPVLTMPAAPTTVSLAWPTAIVLPPHTNSKRM